MRGVGFWVGAVGFCGAGVSVAAPVTVTPPVLKDNTLIQVAGTGATPFSNGGDAIFVGRTNQPVGESLRRGLIAFDFSSIPAGATVSSVSLALHVEKGQSDGVIALHRVTRDWGEGTAIGSGQGGPAGPGDATWFQSFNGSQSWTTAGGDYVSTASATAPASASVFSPNRTPTWSGVGMVSDVQGWLTNPASNFGWELIGNESTNLTAFQLGSSESGTPPVLTIVYDVAVPEPGVVALLGLLPLLATRRRSR